RKGSGWCLTPPSRGRPQAGFAHLRPPLTSNVRRHKFTLLQVLPTHPSMDYLIVIIAAIVGTVWWLRLRPGRPAAAVSIRGASELNDDELVQLQTDFERRIVSGQDLPDG